MGMDWPAGARLIRQAVGNDRQLQIVDAVFAVLGEAPLYSPTMPRSGRPFSVRMSNCGRLGWVSDKTGGYRYQDCHPETGKPWPPIPRPIMALWEEFSGYPAAPEACLINLYGASAKLGSHVDGDELNRQAPVLSLSLGDDAVFHVGGLQRTDPKIRQTLKSGDVVVLGGAARHAFHGIDKVLTGTSDLVPGGGRINLTLRRVTDPASSE